ncbi:von Willebrand factor type A [Desulfovibrio sp. X2]|nr:von Willebrand factor type A [Desulfovibrio sp. X2]
MAVDLGNLYLAQTRLQAATDAAVLAGSLKLPDDPDLSKGKVSQAVNQLLTTNLPDAVVESLTPGTIYRSVTVTTKAKVPMLLMQVLGVGDKWVTASATAGYNNLEVVFVLDNTGSMRGTPITMVKSATANLIDLILPAGGAADTKIGLVGFRGKVRVGSNVDGLPAGCRNADGSVNTGINSAFMSMYWALPSYRRNSIDLDTCSNIPEILPLTSNRSDIFASLATHTADGPASGTVISEGIKWGRNVLTPTAPYTQASSDPKYRKIMILLTDGDTEDGKCGGNYAATYDPNNYWTNAYYGMGDTHSHCENGGALNQAMLDEAQKAKDAGIEIFSIRYGDSDSTDITLMKAVASSRAGTTDHYFNAPSTNDLDDIFKQIGRQLGLRLIK